MAADVPVLIRFLPNTDLCNAADLGDGNKMHPPV